MIDDFRDDQRKIDEFGSSLPEFLSFKFRPVVQIFCKYQARIDELRSEVDYFKAQVDRRANSEKALAFCANDLTMKLKIIEENKWVKLFKWLKVI